MKKKQSMKTLSLIVTAVMILFGSGSDILSVYASAGSFAQATVGKTVEGQAADTNTTDKKGADSQGADKKGADTDPDDETLDDETSDDQTTDDQEGEAPPEDQPVDPKDDNSQGSDDQEVTPPPEDQPQEAEPRDEPAIEDETEATSEEDGQLLRDQKIEAELVKEPLYKDNKQKRRTAPYRELTSLWANLMGRDAAASGSDADLKVILRGELPEGARAEARYISLEEGSVYTEKGLFAIDVTIYDAEGHVYVPLTPVTITVKSSDIKQEIRDGNAPILYSYLGNPKRADKYSRKYNKSMYAADAAVFESEEINTDLLRFEPYDETKKYKKGADAVRYAPDAGYLELKKNSVSFDCDFAAAATGNLLDAAAGLDAAADLDAEAEETGVPRDAWTDGFAGTAHLVLTSQMAKRTVRAKAGAASVKVTGNLAGDVPLKASEIRKKADRNSYVQEAEAQMEKDPSATLSFAQAIDISLTDPDSGAEFQPDSEIKVSIDLNDEKLSNADKVSVVHFKEAADGKSVEPEVVDSSVKGDTVKFTTDGCSVYVVLGYTVETWYRDSEGKDWKITAKYGPETGLPMGVELKVRELAAKESKEYLSDTAKALGKAKRSVKIAKAFDISFEKDGKTYHKLDGDVDITIELVGKKLDETAEVVHFTQDDGKKKTAEKMESETEGNAVSFRSDEFSVYIVSQTELMKRYVFYNGDNVFSEQVLISGESVVMPPIPSKGGAVFDHWKDENDAEAEFPQLVSIDKNALRTTVAAALEKDADEVTLDDMQEYLDDNPVRFDAVYKAAKTTITYYNQAGLVVEKTDVTRPAASEDPVSVDTKEVTYIPTQEKENVTTFFEYWTDDPLGSSAQCGTDGVLEIKSNSPDKIDLYPVLREGHYIYFDGNKSQYSLSSVDYTAAQKVLDTEGSSDAEKRAKAQAVVRELNERTNKAIPTTTGYTFKGWYLRSSGAGDTSVSPSGNLTEPIFYPNAAGTALEVNEAAYIKLLNVAGNLPNNPTLYAHWEANTTANYTVIFWKQKITDDKDASDSEKDYDYAESISTRTAAPGSSVAPANEDKNKGGSGDYVGFHYNNNNTDTSVTVKPDGSTVMNVYYDRDLIEMNFVTRTFTRVTNPSTSQYYYDQNGYIIVYKGSGTGRGWYYIDYSGTYFAHNRTVLYTRNGSQYVKASSYDYNTTYYAKLHNEGDTVNYQWVQLTKTNPYASNLSNCYQKNDSTVTYTGLYGQPLSKYHYTWPQGTWYNPENDSLRWNYVQTAVSEFKGSFTAVTTNAGGETITVQYYFQNTDGTENTDYTRAPDDYAAFSKNLYTTSRSFDNLYTGMHPVKYKIGDSGWETITSQAKQIVLTADTKVYFERNEERLEFYDPAKNRLEKTESVLFGAPLSSYKNYKLADTSNAKFTGWYYDEECKVPVDFDHDTMPAANKRLYAGWTQVKNRVTLIPNGGNMEGVGGTLFHLSEGEKIVLSTEPTRDYIHSEDGTYSYDPETGLYEMSEIVGSGEYSESPGAYRFQGWYKATLKSPGTKKIIQYGVDSSTGAPKYTYAYGEYQQVEAGVPGAYTYNQTTNSYTYVGTGGNYNFVNAEPKVSHGDYSVSRDKYDLSLAPQEPITLVAMWQRTGEFRVVYDTVDPDVNNQPVEAPEDPEEYIDGAHARVLPALTAPKGYALDYWMGPETDDHPNGRYLPNELVHVTDSHAELDENGKDMVVKLTAHYREYKPSERLMADYTFMSKAVEGEGSSSRLADEYTVYDRQRIAVNEELKAPITPGAPDGYTFKGWYYDSEGTRKFDGFGVITNPTYTTLYAVFEEVHTVTYYLTDSSTGNATNTVIATQTYTNGQKLDTRKVIHPVDADHYVHFWVSDSLNNHEDSGKQYPYRSISNKTVTGDMALFAYLGERKYVYFDTHGGSFVETQEIPDNGWPVRPNEPTRKGYIFKGWYTQAEGGLPYEFDQPLDNLSGGGDGRDPDFDPENPVLHAQWTQDGDKEGTLSVIWWAETAEGNTFEHQKTEKIDVAVGKYTSSTFLDSHSDYKNVSNLTKIDAADRSYFEYKADKTVQSFTVDEDNGGVLNLYFTRKRYTLQFAPGTYGTITANGGRTYNNSTRYEIEDVWLDKEIYLEWPANRTGEPKVNPTGDYLRWRVNGAATDEYITAIPLVADTTMLSHSNANNVVIINGNGGTNSKKSIIRYYLDGVENTNLRETISGMPSGTPGQSDSSIQRYSVDRLLYTGHVRGREVTGYTCINPTREEVRHAWYQTNNDAIAGRYESIDSSSCYISFYYTKNTYNVNFFLKEGDDSPYASVDVPYKDVISDYTGGVSDPVPSQPGYRFRGWVEAVGADLVFDQSRNMPAYNISLYPSFEPITYTVTTVGVDGDNSGADDTYSASYGQKLKELHIPNPPKQSGKLFMGWEIDNTETQITGNYEIKSDLRIKPIWNTMETCSVVYKENGGLYSGVLPQDGNAYMYGAKVIIKDGKALYKTLTNVDGQQYTATFAYWNTKPDGSGDTYYPNSTYTFKEGAKDGEGNPLRTLTLYAIYSELRETVLTYDKNAVDAAFYDADDDWNASDQPYMVSNPATIRVFFRDMLNQVWQDKQWIPNQVFPVAQDDNGKKFSAKRTDTLGNEYLLAGWATESDASLAIAQNGDKAYVNTIKDEQGNLKNTLYAVWAICKVVDKNGKEHVFDTIQKAVNFINTTDLLEEEKTGTIEMLIDYKVGPDFAVTVPAGCDVTLTTAKALRDKSADDGVKYYYKDTSHQDTVGNVKHAIITRGFGGESIITTFGTLTTRNIIFDGNGTAYAKSNGAQNDSQAKAMITATKDSGSSTSGSLTMNSGTVIQNAKLGLGNFNGAAVYISDSATVTMNAGSEIKDCMAREGSAIYQQNGTFTMNNGAVITNCNGNFWGGALRINGGTTNLNGGSISNCRAGIDTTDGCGGGLCVTGGTVNIKTGFNISNCIAHKGGGLYISGGTTDYQGGTISVCYATVSGGGVHKASGTLNITGSAQILSCYAKKGGGMYTTGGNIQTANTSDAVIKNCEAKNVIISTDGTPTLANSYNNDNRGGGLCIAGNVTLGKDKDTTVHTLISGCKSGIGGGVYVESGTANLYGCTITNNTATIKGGGVAFNDDSTKAVKAAFKNLVSVQGNYMGTGSGREECNVYLDRDSNTIIESQGLTVALDKHIGVYVPDDDISGKTTTLYEEHGERGTPFGTFTSDKNLSCFVNDRDSVLYGVSKPSDASDKKIYWLDIICKITDINGNLLYKDSRKTRPAVYGKLDGNLINTSETAGGDADSAFGKLAMDDPNLFGSGDSETAEYYTNGKYTHNEYYVKMLVDEYTTSRWVLAPAGRKITFTTATKDSDAEDGYPYDEDARTTYSVIKRGNNTTDSSMMTVKGELILEGITLDGGANLNNGTFTGLSCEQDGGIVTLAESGKVWLREGATLQNSYNNHTGNTGDRRGGGAISNRWKGSVNNRVYIESGSVIRNCGAVGYGGAISLNRGQLTMTGGTITDCYAFTNAKDLKSGLGGAIHFYSANDNNPTRVNLSGGTISNCHAEKSGGGISIDGNPQKALATQPKLYFSGNPAFSGNTITKDGYAGKKNGGEEVYTGDQVRQDIHYPSINGDAPFIQITGNLTSEKGSIWVWAETDNSPAWQHYKENQQFARLSGITEATGLTAFRDAQDDENTENSNSIYLTGVMLEDDTENVYWGFDIKGSRRVILRKTASGSYQPLQGARFEIHRGNADGPSVTIKDREGNDVSVFESGPSGAFFVGNLDYGTYYVKEVLAPEGYEGNTGKSFTVTVNENGVGYLDTDQVFHKEVQN